MTSGGKETSGPPGDAGEEPFRKVLDASPFSLEELLQRQGHEARFLGLDLLLPLPPAREGEVWLAYTHFSILMDKARRLPRLTVVDIHGERHNNAGRRKDQWYPDPRLRPREQPEASLFMTPDAEFPPRFDPAKNHFGFGHMVRRLDPKWGDDEDAIRADRDTFHLTNAVPQDEAWNMNAWEDLEEHVLDEIRDRLKIKAVVYTGPELKDDDPLYLKTFRIPRLLEDRRLARGRRERPACQRRLAPATA
jgi:endonuclease G, mitochondrial